MRKFAIKILPTILVLPCVVYYAISANVRVFYVITGSMEPVIPTKSLVVSKSIGRNEVVVGTVLVYNDALNKRVTAHRVIGARDGGFVTKGDSNEYEDKSLVKPQNIVGRVVGVLPLPGVLLAMFQLIFCLLLFQLGVIHRKFLVFLKHGFSCPSPTLNAFYRLCFFRHSKKTRYGGQKIAGIG